MENEPIPFPSDVYEKVARDKFDAEMSAHWLDHRRRPAFATICVVLVEWMAPG